MKRIYFLSILLMIIGCSQPAAYNVYHTITEEGWNSDAPIAFQIDSIPSKDCQNVLHIRTTRSNPYPYQDLVVEIERTQQGTIARKVDTLQIVLNGQTPQSSAQGINFIDHAFVIDTLTTDQLFCGSIVVRHLMHPPTLSGICAIGWEMRPLEN